MAGFSITETMTGVHEFEPDFGPEGRRPMEFRVKWGTSSFLDYLNPRSDSFLLSELEGTVTVDGLCLDAPCRGTFELRYFTDQTIRYVFEFETNGVTYEYAGTKVNIWPWNLPVSHTTCFGTLKEKESGKLVSRSVVYFKFRTLPWFLASVRPA
jgi:hypothetical protein